MHGLELLQRSADAGFGSQLGDRALVVVAVDTAYLAAFEVINTMQGVADAPPVSQAMAAGTIDLMTRGTSFTDAMELHYPEVKFPCQALA